MSTLPFSCSGLVERPEVGKSFAGGIRAINVLTCGGVYLIFNGP